MGYSCRFNKNKKIRNCYFVVFVSERKALEMKKKKNRKTNIVLLIFEIILLIILIVFDLTFTVPDVEEIMNEAYKEPITSGDIDVIMHFDVDALATKSDAEKIDTNIYMDFNVEFDEDTEYNIGKAKVDIGGMSTEQKTNSYKQISNNSLVQYNKNQDTGEWVKTFKELTSDNNSITSLVTKMDVSILKDLKLKSATDEKYEISAKISVNDMERKMNISVDSLVGGFITNENVDYQQMSYDVDFVIDRKTNLVKTARFSINKDNMISNNIVLNDFRIDFKINELNNVELEVPKKVAEYAISESENKRQELKYEYKEEIKNKKWQSNVKVSDDWTSLTFLFDEYPMKLHTTTLQEFIDNTNYTINTKDFDLEYILNPGDEKIVFMKLKEQKDDWNYLSVRVVNNGKVYAPIKDCVLCKVDYEAIAPFYEGEVYSTMKVAGFEIGERNVDIIGKMGEPASVEAGDKTTKYIYNIDAEENNVNSSEMWDELIIQHSTEYGIVGFKLSSTVWR